jgi:hypothetical protein
MKILPALQEGFFSKGCHHHTIEKNEMADLQGWQPLVPFFIGALLKSA